MAEPMAATRPRIPHWGVQRAIARVLELAPRLEAFDGLVKIIFADGNDASIFVQCPGGKITHEAPGADIRVGFRLDSRDLLLVADGYRNPRLLFGFARTFKVEGAIPDAMHFLDALQGVRRRQPELERAALPKATPDLVRAKADYEHFGYCLLQDAISPQTVAAVRKRVADQAKGEREAGVATKDGGPDLPNQRIWHLPNKGQEFLDLLNEPVIDAFCPEALGDNYIICSYSANIAGKGGDPMYLHYDQGFVDPPIPDMMLGLNIAFFLNDVSEDNGGTRLMPGSARDGYAPDNPLSTDGTVAAEGPAGTALIWDSRLWHGTGTNTTDEPRHVILLFFVRFFIRPQDNYSLLLRDEVKATVSDRIKTMLGFRVTNSLGGVGLGKEGSIVERPAEPIGRLGPAARR